MATLEFRNVNKTYGPGLPDTLKNIELSIKEGEFLILVGPSGCGKSTLMNCIAGLENITGGAILVDDADISGMSPKDRDIAMVFQSYALYPTMSVRENIEFGLKIRKMPTAESTKKSPASPSCCRSNTCSTASRASSPVVSNSVWRWAVRWRVGRRFICSTNRCPTSTPSCASRCAPK